MVLVPYRNTLGWSERGYVNYYIPGEVIPSFTVRPHRLVVHYLHNPPDCSNKESGIRFDVGCLKAYLCSNTDVQVVDYVLMEEVTGISGRSRV